MRKILLLTFFVIAAFGQVRSQYIPYHSAHEDLYNFLSELRVLGIVEYNPTVLPLSRKEIAELLVKADSSASLNPIQRSELSFWMQDFGKDLGSGRVVKAAKFLKRRYFEGMDVKKRLDLLYFANDLFQVTVNPIFSGVGGVNTSGEFSFKNWRGGQMFGRIGKGFGFYFSLVDYIEQPNWSSTPNLSPELGGVHRGSQTISRSIEYYEMKGGVTYGWKWGNVGVVKDHLELGSSGRSQIVLSNRAPSFPRFHLQLKPVKWAELTYTFGWLNSELVDSARSYYTGNGAYRQLFHQKFIAANLVTIRPHKLVSISLGSSIIVADQNLNVGHFIPLMFYTALDQNFNAQVNNAGQNSQIYADLSWDLFGWGQVYGSILIDEIKLSAMFSPAEQRNSLSYQVGAQSRAFTKFNLKVYGHYTRTRPGVYGHYIPTTTYAHAGYGLGHFLGENSDQIVLGFQFRPLAKLRVIAEWQRWRKGPEHVFGNNAGNLAGAQFLTQTLSQSDRIGLRMRYQLINDLTFQLSVDYMKGTVNAAYPMANMGLGQVSDLWLGLGIQVGL